MRILVIEDEKDLRETLKEGLEINGYAVDSAEDGETGLEMLEINSYDLLILDLNLPVMDGMEVLSSLRKENDTTRVLILSARDSISDRVMGIDSGADDYLIKPFHFEELLARMRGLLRRRYETPDSLLKAGNIVLDIRKRSVLIEDRIIQLRPKEYGIFEYLMLNRGHWISQEELIEHVWNEDADPFISSVRVHISRLRKKLSDAGGPDLIESSACTGYRIGGEE